jgi:hypothetical protein
MKYFPVSQAHDMSCWGVPVLTLGMETAHPFLDDIPNVSALHQASFD